MVFSVIYPSDGANYGDLREALEKLNADIRLSIFGDGNYDGICWIVSIENIQNTDENVIVLMMPQGEWLEFTHGNG